MQRTVDDLITIIKDICPSIKASESLFIVDLIIEESKEAYMEGSNKAQEIFKEALNAN